MGSGKSGNESAMARQAEAERQQKIREGTTKIDEMFGQFDDDFYAARKNSYVDYAKPQLEDQYKDANKQLTFSLTRAGLLDSSTRAEKSADLQKKYDINRQAIDDQALALESDARTGVEDSRANLIAMLNSTGDAEGAVNSATARAAALSKPEAYSPLSQMFTDFTNTLSTQAAMERANYHSGGQVASRYDTGLFTPNSGSMTVR